jgi:hypothetical protein
VPRNPAPKASHPDLDERAREMLRQFRGRDVFKTNKSELIWQVAWQSHQQAETPPPDTLTGSITLSGGIYRSAS